MAKPKYRVGQKVVVRDLRSAEHGRKPDRCEGAGIVRGLFARHGRQTARRDMTPPYYVELEDGCTAWYDEDEVSTSSRR